ncbi:MAG: acetyl-CoA carboxylase biotin carboxyl carrier protein [Sphingomonadales bacterium]
MQVDKELIRELADLLDETNLTEIEVEEGDRRIRIARGGGVTTMATTVPMAAPNPGAPTGTDAVAATDPSDHPGAVLSPMVGTVYVSADPGAEPFVKEGSRVEEGQTILIVEAMKVMNSIPAPRGGTIRMIAISNGQPVEYGELLMVIE